MQKYIVVLLGIFLLHGCANFSTEKNVPLAKVSIANASQIIYVTYQGWHTSILLDAKPLAEKNSTFAKRLAGQKFARVGFGDGDYFTGKRKTFSSATQALFASGYSALQLLTYDQDPFDQLTPDSIVPLAITPEGLQKLTSYIHNTLLFDKKGIPILLRDDGEWAGYFYQSNQSYSVTNNCNTWTAAALREAGLPIANRLTSSGVMALSREVSVVQAKAGLLGGLRLR